MEHIWIPDTQTKPDSKNNHLEAAGNYIVEKQPDVIILGGDHWDMPSLSYYDKGTKKIEGARYQDDIDAGNEAIEVLLKPINDYNKRRRKKYKPRKVFVFGNHEDRIARYVNAVPALFGKLSYDDLNLEGWETYRFLQPVDIDGILYCHYFVNMASLKKAVIGGAIENKLRLIGQSFTMGHQQTLQMGLRYLNNGKCQRGLVAGAFYQHNEDYMGIQGNHHFRGCIYKHEVKDGNYDIMELSMRYLLEKWV